MLAWCAASLLAAGPGRPQYLSKEDLENDPVKAADYLFLKFDVGSPKGPTAGPDGLWHAPELAAYVEKSKRPPGEDLSLTTRNMMLMMDTDRSSSVSKPELVAFLRRIARMRGIKTASDPDGLASEEDEEDEEELRDAAAALKPGPDGKSWFFGSGMSEADQENLAKKSAEKDAQRDAELAKKAKEQARAKKEKAAKEVAAKEKAEKAEKEMEAQRKKSAAKKAARVAADRDAALNLASASAHPPTVPRPERKQQTKKKKRKKKKATPKGRAAADDDQMFALGRDGTIKTARAKSRDEL